MDLQEKPGRAVSLHDGEVSIFVGLFAAFAGERTRIIAAHAKFISVITDGLRHLGWFDSWSTVWISYDSRVGGRTLLRFDAEKLIEKNEDITDYLLFPLPWMFRPVMPVDFSTDWRLIKAYHCDRVL